MSEGRDEGRVTDACLLTASRNYDRIASHAVRLLHVALQRLSPLGGFWRLRLRCENNRRSMTSLALLLFPIGVVLRWSFLSRVGWR